MDIHQLDQDLVIVGGKLTLTSTSLPSLSLQPLLTAYNGDQPLIISNAQKETTADVVTIRGTSPFMRVPNLAVTAVFRVDATGTPGAEIRFTLIGNTRGPNAWRFSTSFPDLPLFMDYGKSVTTPQLNVYDELQISNAAFVLMTQAGKDQATGVPLAVGLNFIATLDPTGLLGLFDTLLGGNKHVTVYGTITIPVVANQVTPPLPYQTYPWQVQWPVPGIQLQADLGIQVTISKLKLTNTMLRIYSPLTNDWLASNSSYDPITAITGTLQIPSANISVDTVVELTRGYAYVPIVGIFQGVSLDNLTHLSDLANGNDLFDALPDAVKTQVTKLGGLTLERAAIVLTDSLSAEAVALVSLTVGMPKLQWAVFSAFTVESLSVDFLIDNPFARQGRTVTAQVEGTLDIGGVLLNIVTQVPAFTTWAELPDGTTLPLNGFFQQHVPELPAPPALVIGETQLVITPGKDYLFTATMADDPPWTLDLGPVPLTISNVYLELSKQASATAQGTFQGTLQIGQDLVLTTSYTLPGDFYIRADLPEIKLSSLINLFNEIDLALPAGFDIDFQQAYVLIERVASDLSFSVAASIANLGLVAFTVQKQGKWGFALGVDMTGSLTSLPGLSALAAFESFVGLDTFMLVVSSLDQQDGFQFPDMANFNVPSLSTRTPKLPPQASGLARGLNIYALLTTAKSQGFQVLAKYLGIQLNGTVGMTLAASLPDTSTNSKLFLVVSVEILNGTMLAGELGGLLQGGEVGVFLTAVVKTQVENQPLQFDVTAVVLENGVLISGTMQGTINFSLLQLSNLALVIGLDFEAIPSFGIAATLDISNFESSLALFFDSVDPAKSLAAGAISNVTILDIATLLAKQQNIPAELSSVLGLVGLVGLKEFSMPASVGKSLDNRDLQAISSAFQQYGSIAIPAVSGSVFLVINEQGSVWHLTDTSTMQHYSLTLQGSTIAVALQPQLYITPVPTFVGSIQYPQGFYVVAQIDFLLIQAQIKLIISASQGIAADLDLAPIVILSQDFFSISGATSPGGPQLSLATYSQPTLTDPQLRDPHFLLAGNLRLLGADIAGLYVLIGEQGLTFDIAYQVSPRLHVDLNGTISSLTNLSVGGDVLVGIDRSLDLGPLGSLQINVSVDGALAVSYTGGTPSATYQGRFTFGGIQCITSNFALDVNGPSLQNIDEAIWNQISDIMTKILKNPGQWLLWLKDNLIQGAGQTAEQVGHILATVYQLSADDIASETQHILDYDLKSITEALQGAGCTANDAANALKQVGYSASDIASAIASVYTQTHADINVGHVDTSGPHVDTPSQHVDTPETHIDATSGHTDIAAQHIDSASIHADIPGSPHADTDIPLVGHTDIGTPHVDTNGGHADQIGTPHVDSSPHIDQTATPHGDTSTPHGDTQGPHGDTSTHVDVNT